MAARKVAKPESLTIVANAGTGKTTTLVWTEKGVPKGMTPSDQQIAIFDKLKLTPAKRKNAKIRCSCFNVNIKNELQERLPDVECVTNNGLGNTTVRTFLGRSYLNVDARKFDFIAKDVIGDPWKDRKLFPVIKTLTDLVDMARVTLTGHSEDGRWVVSPEEIVEMANIYSVPIEVPSMVERVEEFINLGIDKAVKHGKLDFNDQVFLPEVFGLSPEKVFRGYVDEAQDLNNAQRSLLLKSAEQIVIVGDPNQSIYLFAGAAPDSMSLMTESLKCQTLPLSVTRRCPKSHVEYAKRFLPPDTLFSAHDSNIDGTIIKAKITNDVFAKVVADGNNNLFISRTNGPLVKHCFGCYRNNIPATIRGRDFAAAAKGKLKKLKSRTNAEAIIEISNQLDKKIEAFNAQGKVDLAEAAQDELAVFMIFLTETETIEEACARIDDMFSDEKLAKGIMFTTAHKAKGLEAHTVGILTPELFPHPKIAEKSPQQAQQERNCAYVAYTRSKDTLIINAEK